MNADDSRISADPIGLFLPWATEEEKNHRERLLRARELASSNLRVARSPHAISLLWMVVETVTAWAYASASVADLIDARRQCMRLARAASFAEREPVR